MATTAKNPTDTAATEQFARAGPVALQATIRARDIMTANVVTVGTEADVRDIARLLSEHRIGAVPVVENGIVVGIVTEGDLLQREELGTEPTYCVAGSTDPACMKSHGRRARDVMTRGIATVSEEASLSEVAELMEERHVKHVPVVRSHGLVGLVSRADIVRALVARPADPHAPLAGDDDVVRYMIIAALMNIPGASAWLTAVEVTNGIVRLRGVVENEDAREPSRFVIESIAGVLRVEDDRTVLQPF